MKKLALLLLSLFFLLPTPSFALHDGQGPKPTPPVTREGNVKFYAEEETPGSQGIRPLEVGRDGVTENTPRVWLKFTGLATGDELTYRICDEEEEECTRENDPKGREVESEITEDGLWVLICADGVNDLHYMEVSGLGEFPEGDDGHCTADEFFHRREGAQYYLSLYLQRDGEDALEAVAQARFGIFPYYPDVKTTFSNSTLNVNISGNRRPADEPNRNDYEVRVEGVGGGIEVGRERCVVVPPNGTGTASFDSLLDGEYLLKVNEAVNVDSPDDLTTDCEGAFSYVFMNFAVKDGQFEEIKTVWDPNKTGTAYLRSEKFPPADPPCLVELVEGLCPRFDSALGEIDTSPTGFIRSAMGVVLSLAGGIALVIIIVSGYRIMTSAGNEERLKGARESLTSAIVGLLFIIFSVVILQVIGVDILGIPGFNP